MSVQRRLAVFRRVAVAALSLLLLGVGPALAAPDEARVRARLGDLRLPFIANQGQVDPRVAYYAPTFAGTLFVTQQGELVHALPGPGPTTPGMPLKPPGPGWTLTETLVDGVVRPVAGDRGATGVGVFLGNDPARWRRALTTHQHLVLGETWPGVSVTLHARGRSVEKVFTVKPGAAVERIRVRVGGAEALSVDPAGNLVARTGLGPVTFSAPAAYQDHDGVRRPVAVAYGLHGSEYGFTVGAYDRGVPLVIDPLLQSTYLGGSSLDQATAVAVHPATGDVYVAGFTVLGVFPGTLGGAQPAGGGTTDAFVARLNSALTLLIQATYLGGTDLDAALALAIDPATSDVYVAGLTGSGDFPGTPGGADSSYQPNGDFLLGSPVPDVFVARLDSTLTVLRQSTYFGDLEAETATALAIHPATGDVYVAGGRRTVVFVGPPPPDGASGDSTAGTRFSPAIRSDAFVARLNNALTALLGSTFFAGVTFNPSTASALAIHPATGEVYVAGTTGGVLPNSAGGAQPGSGGGATDAFVARFATTLGPPLQSTYLGGTGDDAGNAMAIDPITGDVYVGGRTSSADLPGTAGGAQPTKQGGDDGFVARLDGALTTLKQSTYLGGGDADSVTALGIQAATGDVYVAGFTDSTDLPGTAGGAQPMPGGDRDVFLARLLDSLVTLVQATYLGGTGLDSTRALAIHPLTGDLYTAGSTDSTDFPHTAGGAQPASGTSTDAFVARLTFGLAAVDPHFADVLSSHPFFAFIETLAAAGLTSGCAAGPPRYCPDDGVTRSEMAVFLERGIHGATFDPPAPTGTVFADVPADHPFAKWIEQLARDAITGGCAAGPPRYCPDEAVTRAQMAVFLLRAKHGAGYEPPPATGTMFLDVPIFHPFAKWIEQLAREGITGGCAPLRYCPTAVVSRDQMAAFLDRTFGL